MLECRTGQMSNWYGNSWLRGDWEQIDWVQELKLMLWPWGTENMTARDGVLVGLPFWSSTKYLVFNDLAFEAADITEPPSTWDEFEEQCARLKAAGITVPYIPFWRRDAWGLGWSIFVEAYSDGDYIFDSDDQLLVGEGDTPFRQMLERWKRLYDAELVPQNAFEIDDPVIIFNSGDHAFTMIDDFAHKRCNDAAQSAIAGHVHNILNPGTTHETAMFSQMYAFGLHDNIPAEEQADLARFFTAAYTDGQYHVAQRWALEEGLATANSEIMAMPEVEAEFARWRDVAVYNQQLDLGRPRNVQKRQWYASWEENLRGLVEEFVKGERDIDNVLGNLMVSAFELQQDDPEP